MLQRIQTVYLLITGIALSLLFFFPFIEFVAGDSIYSLIYRGLYSVDNKLVFATFPLAILSAITVITTFINSFLFKNRKLQMRLCIINTFLMIGLIVLISYYTYIALSEITAVAHYSFPLIIPIIGIILTLMARRGIKKDEKLVRSLDRIR